MNRKQSQNRTTTLSDWLELFYLQAVLLEQNDPATPLFALNFATCSGIPLRLATLFTSRH
jgi:hypothetical protein